MKRYGTFTAAVLIAAIAAVRIFLPELVDAAGSHTAEFLDRDGEYAAAFERLGDELAVGREAEEPLPAETARPERRLLSVAVQTTERPTEPTEAAELTLSLPAEEENTEIPEAVEAFLESQAPFADYPLPDTVDYSYAPLPFAFTSPLAGRNSSGFGYRLHPILNTVRFHYGTDIAALSGEPICAFADGTVSFVGYDESYGWHLSIDHGAGWQTAYAHCSAVCVTEGQHIAMGECIALVGETGLATGPHLHLELTEDGLYRNPEYYLNG